MTGMDSSSAGQKWVEVNGRGLRPAVEKQAVAVVVVYNDDNNTIKLGLVRVFTFRDIARVHTDASYDTLLAMKKKLAQVMATKLRPTQSRSFLNAHHVILGVAFYYKYLIGIAPGACCYNEKYKCHLHSFLQFMFDIAYFGHICMNMLISGMFCLKLVMWVRSFRHLQSGF